MEGNKLNRYQLIKRFSYVAKQLPSLKIYVKKHPRLNFSKNIIDLPNNIEFLENKFSYLASNSKISACSGASTTVLESLSYGCRLIIPIDNGYDKQILKNLKISNDIFRICENKFQLLKAVNYFLSSFVM